MKVQNYQSYDITCVVGGKHYYFRAGEVKEVPEIFKGKHTACLKEYVEVVKKPKPITIKLPEDVKSKIKRVQKNESIPTEINTERTNLNDDKPVFSPKIDEKIKNSFAKKTTKKPSTTKKKTIRGKKSKISKSKRLSIRKQLAKNKQERK